MSLALTVMSVIYGLLHVSYINCIRGGATTNLQIRMCVCVFVCVCAFVCVSVCMCVYVSVKISFRFLLEHFILKSIEYLNQFLGQINCTFSKGCNDLELK